MKLYTITISAHIDDLDTLEVHLDADVEVADASLREIAMRVLPTHLRKVASDTEAKEH